MLQTGHALPRSVNSQALVAICIVACAILLNGCADPAEEQRELDELFDRAEYEILEAQYDTAQATLKEFLLKNAEHSGAHYYLARTYTFGSSFRPDMAIGELQLALELFTEQGRKSSIERFQDDYFEVICNLDAAKVFIVQITFMQNLHAPPAAWAGHLAQAEAYVDKAKAILPESNDVTTYEQLVRGLKG